MSDNVQSKKHKGKLTIYFGACAGVGKTYDMLSAAQQELKEKIDVVAGVVETHGRVETGKLLEGIPQLPLKEYEYQGILLKDFDLDGALKRNPDILLVDELAHSNIKTARHPKRWQDIQELLDAGIDVFTTLNVQHLESLNDTIENLTGVRVKETIPDSVFDNAHEIVLVDIPSEIILERLQEGKVYLGEFAKQRASQHFFKLENLIVLRELALRRTAERVDALRDVYLKYKSGGKKSILSDKILVCIGSNPISTKLIRTAKQQASRLKCSWTALYVEDEKHYYLAEEEKTFIEKSLRLAEQLGGSTKVLQSTSVLNGILQYSQENEFSRIIIGKSYKPTWKRKFSRSLANNILEASDVVDIFVINEDVSTPPYKPRSLLISSWLSYFNAFFVVALCTIIALPLRDWLQPENVIMIYLAGLVFVSVIEERSAALWAALLSMIGYNLIFTQPYYQFRINTYHAHDFINLFVFILVAIVITSFTSRLRSQNISIKQREKYMAELYELSRKLLVTPGRHKIAKVVSHHISETFNSAVTVWLPNNLGILELASHPGIKTELKEESVAQWAFTHNQPAGMGTDTMPSARGYYLPLNSKSTVLGVLGIVPKDPNHIFSTEETIMLESLALQASLALERIKINR